MRRRASPHEPVGNRYPAGRRKGTSPSSGGRRYTAAFSPRTDCQIRSARPGDEPLASFPIPDPPGHGVQSPDDQRSRLPTRCSARWIRPVNKSLSSEPLQANPWQRHLRCTLRRPSCSDWSACDPGLRGGGPGRVPTRRCAIPTSVLAVSNEADSLIMSCHRVVMEFAERGIAAGAGFLGQPEHSLADDVSLDLVRTAVDRRRR
jgi:hypothetical protein